MTTYAINTQTLGPTTWSGLTMVGFCDHDGTLYGATATEVLEFTGTDDGGTDIDAYVQTGKIGQGFYETRYLRAYVQDQYANSLMLTTLIDRVDAEEEASEQSIAYTISSKVGARQHGRAVRLRSDVKGTGWAWKVANVDGGGLVLRGLSVQPETIEIDV